MKTIRYIVLEVIFLASVVAVAILHPLDSMEWWIAAFLPFAVLRMAVTISENEVMSWARKPFCVTAPDSCGAGLSVVAKHNSTMGELLSCPICSGTWAALVLVALYALVHPVGVMAIVVLGGAGAAEFLYFAKEQHSWQGRLARVRDGLIEDRENCEDDMFPGVTR